MDSAFSFPKGICLTQLLTVYKNECLNNHYHNYNTNFSWKAVNIQVLSFQNNSYYIFSVSK